MSTYIPNNWVIVEATSPQEETFHKVLAGWYGGFANGDSWKFSSGIKQIKDCGKYWEIQNHSGSIYQCGKNCEKLSMNTSSIFNSYAAQAKERDIEFSVVNITNILEKYSNE